MIYKMDPIQQCICAHEGKGIGLRFLRHIERNSLLLFMISIDSDDIQKEYDILLNELNQHNPELMDKQRILAITKSDILDDDMISEMQDLIPKDIPSIFISSITNKGIPQLKDMLWKELNREIEY